MFTVGQLKKALEGQPDNLPVYFIPKNYMLDNHYVEGAEFHEQGPINNEFFGLQGGEEFGW